jgi:hypothetical protein
VKRKTFVITLTAVVAIALASAGALFALSSVAHSYQTCGKVKPAELRRAADPRYAATLEKLGRCGS